MSRKRVALAWALLCAVAQGQQAIGRVTLRDAAVTGTMEVSGDQAMLRGGASIVARDHTAEVALDRGGALDVCATSSLHVTSGKFSGDLTPLLFALDRGAMELRTLLGAQDAIMTPDLRFSTATGGRVDLRLRVTSNGDTCVESRGAGSPTVDVVEQFGNGRYQVRGGQHVLFEHGSIHEVVDKESSPCGCPPAPVVSVADGRAAAGAGEVARPGSPVAPAAEQHPFPAAQSQGLAPEGPVKVPQAPAGEVHAQVAATMAFQAPEETGVTKAVAAAPAGSEAAGVANGGTKTTQGAPTAVGGKTTSGGTAAVARSAAAAPVARAEAPVVPQQMPAVVQAPPPAPAPPIHDFAHLIGRFLKRVFRRG